MTALLDPRWHWLMDAVRRAYAALDTDERVVGLTLLSGSADGEMITTQVLDGIPEVQRLLVPDQDRAIASGAEFLDTNAVRLTLDHGQ